MFSLLTGAFMLVTMDTCILMSKNCPFLGGHNAVSGKTSRASLQGKAQSHYAVANLTALIQHGVAQNHDIYSDPFCWRGLHTC